MILWRNSRPWHFYIPFLSFTLLFSPFFLSLIRKLTKLNTLALPSASVVLVLVVVSLKSVLNWSAKERTKTAASSATSRDPSVKETFCACLNLNVKLVACVKLSVCDWPNDWLTCWIKWMNRWGRLCVNVWALKERSVIVLNLAHFNECSFKQRQ